VVAIDTNILVRLLTGDDPAQYQASRQLFEHEDIFIAETVILETEWVLRHAYQFSSASICGAFRKIFGLPNVSLTPGHAGLIAQALEWHEKGLDFADALHLSLSQHHAAMKTFDEKFIKKAKKLSKCPVEKP
jgi:predicted nucleic-acid-binding protein